MTWAVPGSLHGVPGDLATQMRAHGRYERQLAILATRHGHFLAVVLDDAAAAHGDRIERHCLR